MDDASLSKYVAAYGEKYPPLISFEQAAEIAHLPLATVYDYSSRGYFDNFKHPIGRYRLLDLAAFVRFILTPRNA